MPPQSRSTSHGRTQVVNGPANPLPPRQRSPLDASQSQSRSQPPGTSPHAWVGAAPTVSESGVSAPVPMRQVPGVSSVIATGRSTWVAPVVHAPPTGTQTPTSIVTSSDSNVRALPIMPSSSHGPSSTPTMTRVVRPVVSGAGSMATIELPPRRSWRQVRPHAGAPSGRAASIAAAASAG